MNSKPGRISELYQQDRGARESSLNRARECAMLSKPWVLPFDEKATGDNELIDPATSLVTRGITGLEGRMLLALFPPGRQWFRFRPAANIRFSPEVQSDPEYRKQLEMYQQHLYIEELAVIAILERARTGADNQRRLGFRTPMRQMLSSILVTGDTLGFITDDFRIRVFRRDHYTTRRDSSGSVLRHITVEQIDPLSLPEEILEKADLKAGELAKLDVSERLMELFTRIEWQPLSKQWLIEQEINGETVTSREEKVSPYLSVPFDLVGGEDYGRGFVEQNLGDARSFNELTLRLLENAAVISRMLIAKDHASATAPSELLKPSGSIISAHVDGGRVMDVGFLMPERFASFDVPQAARALLGADLASAMLMETELQPRGDRVTAFQVQRVALDLDSALGGVYTPIADALQQPLLARVVHMMRKKQMLRSPEETVESEIVTGVAALAQEQEHARLMGLMQVISTMPELLMQRVNVDTLLHVLMRQLGIYEPSLIKTDAELQAEAQAAMQQQIQMMGAEEAVGVAGDTARAAATGAMQ